MPIDDVPRVALGDQAETTLNSIGDAVLSTDLEGNVGYLNLAAEAMTGWSRESAVGRPLEEVLRLVDHDTRDTAPNPMSSPLISIARWDSARIVSWSVATVEKSRSKILRRLFVTGTAG